MQKKNKKHVFIIIIVLLAIFLSLGLGGFILALEGAQSSLISKAPTNIDREFFYEGFLYFYDENEKLVGVYECQNKSGHCGYALETIDDNSYSLNYYNDETIDEVKMINNKYAFIVDAITKDDSSNKIYLYNILDSRIVLELVAIKNYTIGIEENRYIVKNADGKWGVLSMDSENPVTIIPFEYDYIGVKDNKNEFGYLIADKYVGYKENQWYVIDNNNANLSAAYNNMIADYNGNYVITKALYYYLSDYTGNLLYNGSGYREISFTGNYINLLNRTNFLVVVDPVNDKELTPPLEVPTGIEYSVYIQGIKIVVEINGNTSSYDL